MAIRIRADVFAKMNSPRDNGVKSVLKRVFLVLSCTIVIDDSRNEMNIRTIDTIAGIRKSR